jgi:hypothetical protein
MSFVFYFLIMYSWCGWSYHWVAVCSACVAVYGFSLRARFTPIISFGRNKIKWYIILFHKSTEITGYQTWIKVRHEMKILEFQMNSVTNSMAPKQVILVIANQFFDLALNDSSQTWIMVVSVLSQINIGIPRRCKALWFSKIKKQGPYLGGLPSKRKGSTICV